MMPLIPSNVDKDVYFRSNIERMVALMKSLSDTELGIYQKNWYFGFHKDRCVWPVTNFTDSYPPMPEFKADPVMQKLRQLYVTLGDFADCLPFSDKNEFVREEIRDTSILLSEFATQMGNRRMDESNYLALFEDKHPSLIKASSLIKRLQKEFVV